MSSIRTLAAALILAFVSVSVAADKAAPADKPVGGNFGNRAADFPPGDFSDNGHYTLADFQGKVVILFFYENSCPRCRGEIPERNKVVAAFKDKPVKFLAIGPHDTLADVRDYFTTTRLAMPIFADPFGVMQKRYGFSISLQNIYQFRAVGPDGIIRGYDMSEDGVNKAIADIHWTFKDAGYNPKLAPAIDLFEWNQWAAGMKLLKPHLSASDKDEKASAEKLFEEIKTRGQQWKEQADGLVETDPVQAFDLYQKIAAVFGDDALAKSVADPLKTLRQKKEVIAELDARKAYGQLESALTRATPDQKEAVAGFCRNFVKKYPDTPTSQKVQAYLDDLTR